VTEAQGAVYVYGVLSAADAGAVTAAGIEGTRVRAIEHDRLAALVSDVDGEALAAPAVRAHWRVLDEAAERGTVLPVRFGTVMASERAVRDEFLAPQAPALAAKLEALAGRVQLTVKGAYDEERLLRAVVREAPAVGALRDRVRRLPDAAGYYDRIRLGELVATEVARRRVGDERRALERLQPLAVDARAEPPARTDAAFNLAFLVDRGGVDGFSRAVAKLGEEVADRIAIEYVGPMPPYSFAETERS
jgi:hypothetical protein